MSQKKAMIAVVLSGCGSKDGAEIHESVLTMLAIDRNGALYKCFAPDIPQAAVVNHITEEEISESRNVLVESARIARGEILPLSKFVADDFDALIFPGGLGAAKNLCTFASDGVQCSVNKDVSDAVNQMVKSEKPIGALCIAPMLLARLIDNAKITIGNAEDVAATVESMGGIHKKTGHAEIVVDEKNRLVTTPCYMLDATISQIAQGADNLVKEILNVIMV